MPSGGERHERETDARQPRARAQLPPCIHAKTCWDSSKFKSCFYIYILHCSEWLQSAEAMENQVSPAACLWRLAICSLATSTGEWSIFPIKRDFSFRSCLPPALFFSFAHARCSIRAQTAPKNPLFRRSHQLFVQFTDTTHTHMVFFFFLRLPAISAWFYTISHSDNSEENLFFHCQRSVLRQLSSVLTSVDPATLGQFRGGAANLVFPTVF